MINPSTACPLEKVVVEEVKQLMMVTIRIINKATQLLLLFLVVKEVAAFAKLLV